MARMTSTMTTSFPKMGDEGIPHSIVNLSGNRSPYTQVAGKKTEGRGASPTGKKVNRGASEIKEAQGPTYKPVTTIYYPNAPENQKPQSRTYMVPSAMGKRDFWNARNAAGNTGGT